MTKPDTIKSEAVKRDGARSSMALKMKGALFLARSRSGRGARTARAMLNTLDPLGAALWALYPVAIVLLIVGFLFAGFGSV